MLEDILEDLSEEAIAAPARAAALVDVACAIT